MVVLISFGDLEMYFTRLLLGECTLSKLSSQKTEYISSAKDGHVAFA